ncbi:MAG TPA: enoyl-CoA hydratase-related protein [Rhizomicrobium sp.]|jgi:enoyl-CoA hydratase|nr:enoyl-CoA hydratase-related protein [Rhizomicrobium sp.]
MSCFRLEVADGIAQLVLDRPDANNSMTPDFWRELPALVRDIEGGAKARVIVLSSTGRHFSSGMDLSALAGIDVRDRAGLRRTIRTLQDSFNAIAEARIPVLAAIQGGCIGAAVDLIAACDCRYATADAYFVIQEINLAMVADCGTFPRLTRLMPDGMVREMAFTGGRLAADRALALGLVNAVLPDTDALTAHVMAVAKEIAAKSPRAMAGTKRTLDYGRDHSVAETLEQVAAWQAAMLDPAEVMEAMAARTEKRVARFAPRKS